MSINSDIEKLNNLMELEKIKLKQAKDNIDLYKDLLLKINFEITFISVRLAEVLKENIVKIKHKHVLKAIKESRILLSVNPLSDYVMFCCKYKYQENNVDKEIYLNKDNVNEFIKIFNTFK